MGKYTVYMHTNKINGKKYIGITCQDAERRWRSDGHGYKNNRYFYNSIKKHGWSNFESVVLMSGLTKEQAELQETKLIAEHNTTDRTRGYNNARGGGANGFHTEQTKKKMSEKAKNRPVNLRAIQRMAETNRAREYSKEHRKKISQALTGKKLSPEHCKSISESHKGYKMPDEQKRKISTSIKKTLNSKEIRARMSERSKNNPAIIQHLMKLAVERIKYNEPVILTNTGEMFENHLTAGKEYNIQPFKIVANCSGEAFSAGKDKFKNPRIWCYVKDYNKNKDYQLEYKEKISKMKRKACLAKWHK